MNDNYKSWKDLTKGRFNTGYNLYKGMPYHAEKRGVLPSINFHINPFKEDGKLTPWRDLVLQEEGKVLYNGDNKTFRVKASESRGNKVVLSILDLYNSN